MNNIRSTDDFKKEVFDIYGNDYEVLGIYKGRLKKVEIRHKCGYAWEIQPNSLINNRIKACPVCSGKKKKTTEEYIQQVKELVGDEYVVKGKYINTMTNIEMFHTTCNFTFPMSPDSFLHNHRCPKCNGGVRLKDTEYFKQEVYDLVGDEYELLGEYSTCRTPIEFLHTKCNRKYNATSSDFLRGHRCPECAIERRLGEGHWNWQGGITSLTLFLRNCIKEWKFDSMKSCNYKCIITGERFDTIHHLYSFSQIIKETLNNLDIPSKEQVADYTELELESIKNTFLEIHDKHGNGVCLTDKIHKLFHLTYTYYDNTPEQFIEFTQRYK